MADVIKVGDEIVERIDSALAALKEAQHNLELEDFPKYICFIIEACKLTKEEEKILYDYKEA